MSHVGVVRLAHDLGRGGGHVPELHGEAADVAVTLDVDQLNLGAVRWAASELCASVVRGDVVDANLVVQVALASKLGEILNWHLVFVWVALDSTHVALTRGARRLAGLCFFK